MTILVFGDLFAVSNCRAFGMLCLAVLTSKTLWFRRASWIETEITWSA